MKKFVETYYESLDGKKFNTKQDCFIYELQLLKLILTVDGLRKPNKYVDNAYIYYPGGKFENYTAYAGIYLLSYGCINLNDGTTVILDSDSIFYFCDETDYLNKINGYKYDKENKPFIEILLKRPFGSKYKYNEILEEFKWEK